MANLCDNTLVAYSENEDNLKYIANFFKNALSITRGDNQLEIAFDSKWCFPNDEMDTLYLTLPDKTDINMTCLSTEWGNLYTEFHTCDENGWKII